jgi:hypothetical protein
MECEKTDSSQAPMWPVQQQHSAASGLRRREIVEPFIDHYSRNVFGTQPRKLTYLPRSRPRFANTPRRNPHPVTGRKVGHGDPQIYFSMTTEIREQSVRDRSNRPSGSQRQWARKKAKSLENGPRESVFGAGAHPTPRVMPSFRLLTVACSKLAKLHARSITVNFPTSLVPKL